MCIYLITLRTGEKHVTGSTTRQYKKSEQNGDLSSINQYKKKVMLGNEEDIQDSDIDNEIFA